VEIFVTILSSFGVDTIIANLVRPFKPSHTGDGEDGDMAGM